MDQQSPFPGDLFTPSVGEGSALAITMGENESPMDVMNSQNPSNIVWQIHHGINIFVRFPQEDYYELIDLVLLQYLPKILFSLFEGGELGVRGIWLQSKKKEVKEIRKIDE